MAMKIEMITYKDNPAATFWARLGSFLTYFTPVLIFALVMLGLPITDGHGIGMVLWVIGSIAVGVAYCILCNKFCDSMVEKSVKKSGNSDNHNVLD